MNIVCIFTGPSNWYKTCPIANDGKRQSPVDLIDKDVKSDSNLKPLVVSYPPFSHAKLMNNGHSVVFQPDASDNSSGNFNVCMKLVNFSLKFVGK